MCVTIKRPAGGLGAYQQYLKQVLATAKRYSNLDGVRPAEIAARIKAFEKARSARGLAKGASRPFTKELERQMNGLKSKAAAFVGICRLVAELTGDKGMMDGAPAQTATPSRRRAKKAAAAQA